MPAATFNSNWKRYAVRCFILKWPLYPHVFWIIKHYLITSVPVCSYFLCQGNGGFLLRHVVVHFTGRPLCSTQQAARGQALCLCTPSLQPGGSKTDLCSSQSNQLTTSHVRSVCNSLFSICRLLHSCHDDASRFIYLLTKPGCSYLEQEDFIPLLQVHILSILITCATFCTFSTNRSK